MFKLHVDAKLFQIDLILENIDIDILIDVMSPYKAGEDMDIGC